jgi:hypothetical protein
VIDKADLPRHQFRAEPGDGLLPGNDPRLSLLLELLIEFLECANDAVFSNDFDEEGAFFEGIDGLKIVRSSTWIF